MAGRTSFAKKYFQHLKSAREYLGGRGLQDLSQKLKKMLFLR